jgi:hypothetical protein
MTAHKQEKKNETTKTRENRQNNTHNDARIASMWGPNNDTRRTEE